MPKLPENLKFLGLSCEEKKLIMKIFDFLLFAKGDINKKKKKCCESIEILIGNVYELRSNIPLSTNDYHVRIIEASINYNIEAHTIVSKQRNLELSRIRKEIITKMHDQDKISLHEIGFYFNRDYKGIHYIYNSKQKEKL